MSQATLEPIRYKRGSLELLNQIKLPFENVFEDSSTCQLTFDAIRDMKTRGAPAIAIAAVLGLSAELFNAVIAGSGGPDSEPELKRTKLSATGFSDLAEAKVTILAKLDFLEESRPTAVNLRNAMDDLRKLIAASKAETVAGLVNEIIEASEAMYHKDAEDNRLIGEHGSKHFIDTYSKGSKVTVLTHCNAGALATVKYGTALSVVRFLQAAGQLERVYCTETRPYNQGARLTAYECVYEGCNTTLICDSCVSYLLSTNPPTAVVVGADRVCMNGDTANKIGTLQIAIACKHFGVPFYIAAPTTTIDTKLLNGLTIPIEERTHKEVTHLPGGGNRVVVESDLLTVWNPAFDITPAHLITGLITENGVVLNKSGVIPVADILKN